MVGLNKYQLHLDNCDLTNTQKAWINNALKIAMGHNSGGRARIVAIAVKGNRISGIGYNFYPTRRAGKGVYTLLGTHAEANLLENYLVKDCTIYVVGLTKSNNLLVSRPCARCNNLLRNSSAKQIIYLNKNYTWELKKIRELDIEQNRVII